MDLQPPPLPQRRSKVETPEPDLISFTAAAEAPKPQSKEDPELNKKIEQILKVAQSSSCPAIPQSTSTSSMQLVPYNNQQIVPKLTNETLSSLYRLNQPNSSMFGQQQYYNRAISYGSALGGSFPVDPTYGYSPSQNSFPLNSFQQNTQTYGFRPEYLYGNSSASSVSSFHQFRPKATSEEPRLTPPPLPINPPPSSITNSTSQQNNIYVPMDRTQLKSKNDVPGPSSLRRVSSIKKTDDLIDLDVEDSSSTNILDSFDPLTKSNRNSAEEAENSFYSDYDPFEYIYSGGTNYSDPLYEAVIRNDVATPQQSPDFESFQHSSSSFPHSPCADPPPLPPRNIDGVKLKASSIYQDYTSGQSSLKLYENVVMTKNYDKELIAFYQMVKELRGTLLRLLYQFYTDTFSFLGQYKYDDEQSNVGHVVASEFDNVYFSDTSIKLLVYPSNECNRKKSEPNYRRSSECGFLDGFSQPIIFTSDSECYLNSAKIFPHTNHKYLFQ